MVHDREITVGLPFLWNKQRALNSGIVGQKAACPPCPLTNSFQGVSLAVEMSSLCAAAAAARGLGLVGGSWWPVAGWVKSYYQHELQVWEWCGELSWDQGAPEP